VEETKTTTDNSASSKSKFQVLQDVENVNSGKPIVETPLLQEGQSVPKGFVAILIPVNLKWGWTKVSSTGKSLGMLVRSEASFTPVNLSEVTDDEGKSVADINGRLGFLATNVNISLRIKPKNMK
jgi:hypothetical protein